MSNEEQHKNVIAGKDNSIKIKGGLEVEGDLTLKGESAGLGGGSGAFSEEEMKRLLAAGNVTVPEVAWANNVEARDVKEGHVIIERDLAQKLDTNKMNYRSIVLGARAKYDVTPNDSTSYTFSQNGVDTVVDGNTSNIDLIGFRTGETITFENTSDSHPLEIVDSNDVVVATQSGKTTAWTPTATGSYKYRCQTHPTVMTGDMTVVQGADALFEIVSSARSTSNNPGNLDKNTHPEVFTLRYLVGPDGSDSAGSENAAVDCLVTAIGLLGEYAQQTFEISVKNLLADDAPSWDDAPSSFTVAERDASGNQPVTLLQHRLLAKRKKADLDADGNVMDSYPAEFTHPDRYEILAELEGQAFELVSDGNSPSVANGADAGQQLTDILQFNPPSEPDFENDTQYTVKIRAYNDWTIGTGDASKYSDHIFTINISDSAWDNAPVWQTESISIGVNEGNDTRSGGTGADNTIDGPLNLRKYLQTVTLSDTTGNVLNDPPGNTANPNAQEYTFSIHEPNDVGQGVTGNSTNTSSSASDWFSCANGGSGQTGNPWLTFLSNKIDNDGIDFETTNAAWGGSSLGSSDTFYMTIRATNPREGKSADKTVAFFIINDHTDDAPEWTGTVGTTSGSPKHTPENQTLELINLPNQINTYQRGTTSFAIAADGDGAKFEISNDHLKFINALDFENPTDVSTAGLAGNDNLYAVKIIATNSKGIGKDDSGGRTTEKWLFIEVTDDTADNTAHFPESAPGWSQGPHTINELDPNNTLVYTIPGGGQFTDHYQIASGGQPNIGGNTTPFTISGGEIRTAGTIDLTNETTTNFNLTIEAVNSNGGAGDARTFVITVTNVLTDEFDMNNPFEFTVEP
jgi:hypothetical protein